ncbi:MAG: symmetrical bis(5'-nucleosyl)-tetraphosphatase [Burkholderiaceae bacterium]
MHFLIGDLQGCRDAFDRLLAEIGFSPSRHRLHVLGDLVNRGPDNVGVLRRLEAFGDAATCLLGNHDLHLLAVAAGVRRPHRGDTFDDILHGPEREKWLAWLRRCRMADQAHGWLLVHAGVPPQWDAAQTLALAAEVEACLRSDRLDTFLRQMYGNEPVRWADDLLGIARIRVVVNALTRIRFCSDDGTMDFIVKEGAGAAPPGMKPWFEIATRRTAATPVAFGHWSTIGLINEPGLLSLDTGCVWGRELTAARIDGGRVELIQVDCAPARAR